jgi:hypothetical protein
MSRYYCENCKITITYKEGKDCPFCDNPELRALPDYETLEQYEKRTGRKWEGAIWIRCINKECAYHVHSNWIISTTRSLVDDELHKDCSFSIVICANLPKSPPDNWRPS